MSERLEKQFITQKEHEDIVDFYKKVVAFQHRTIRDLRELIAVRDGPREPEEEFVAPQIETQPDNVITVEFRRQR